MGRWKNRLNNKLILTEIFPSVHESWYLKVLNTEGPILVLNLKLRYMYEALLTALLHFNWRWNLICSRSACSWTLIDADRMKRQIRRGLAARWDDRVGGPRRVCEAGDTASHDKQWRIKHLILSSGSCTHFFRQDFILHIYTCATQLHIQQVSVSPRKC